MSDDANRFLTLQDPFGPAETREKDSRFLAYVMPSISLNQARARVEDLRRAHRGARHVCWAVRWHCGGGAANVPELKTYSTDDGEPAGTAGIPILRELEGRGCANLVAAVVRFFGGTLLGKGGLARAYGGAVAAALAEAPLEWREFTLQAVLELPFAALGTVMRLVERHRVTVHHQRYHERGIVMDVSIPLPHHVVFQREIQTAGRGSCLLKIEADARK